ncbi:MAG: DUF885 domain-containing protein [Proteobacteria bacterium]|nr:DUF885 domain-containing protein [Pseudomonadota bacterium]
MRKFALILLAASLALAGCGGEQGGTAPTTADSEQPWAEFASAFVDEYYRRNPEVAVDAGLHQYDGQASDLSLAAFRDYAAWLENARADVSAYTGLPRIEAFERDYLLIALRSRLFWLNETDRLTKNPVFYAGSIDLSVYVDREYAPLDVRIQAYTMYATHIPGMLQSMKANLEPPLPAPFVEIGGRIFAGLAEYLQTTVPEIFAPVDDEQLQHQFKAANDAAAEAVQQAAEWIQSLKATATNDFALGEEVFLRMLRETEGIDISLADLKAAGELNLQSNLDLLNESCAEFAPGESTRDCVLMVQGRKPPEGAVAGARRQLPILRQFLIDEQIVSIPGTEDALVDESPPHRRFNFAYINIPGAFETGMPSVYYIAPPDPEWSEEDRLAYVPGETDLLATSVHEVWPGHFLNSLHRNRIENKIGRHFRTYTFSEGWAHYTEQMMVDAGLGDGDPEVRIGQLLNALLRNARYLSAIGLHAEGMTIEESQKLFEDKGFQDFGNATQQAYRGTYNPGYLSYTLGKLMIHKLREDWTAGRGGREAWGEFHDRFLSYGKPPIPLLRDEMLRDNYDGDTALLPH